MRSLFSRVSVIAFPLLGACATLQRHAAREEVEVVADQVYVDGSRNPKHRLDLFLPRNRPGFPVVVFIHGGYWRAGDRNYYSAFTGLYGSIGLALAKRGIGTAVISYRIAPEVMIEGAIEDAARAVHWTLGAAAARGAKADRFFLAGHSAGGHLALLLASDGRYLQATGIDPKRVRGVVALSPVVDLADMRARNDAAFNADVTDRVFGTDPARLTLFSPVTHLRPDLPPILLVLGARDYPYLAAQVRSAAGRLREMGAPAELREIPGYTHEDMVLKVGSANDAVTPIVAAFVEATMRAGK